MNDFDPGNALPRVSVLAPHLRQTIDDFFTYILKSPFMYSMAEYGIGYGDYLGSVFPVPANGMTTNPTTDAQIRAALAQWIEDGTVKAPNAIPGADVLYFIYLSAGVSVTKGTEVSGTDFAGYHSFFTPANLVSPVYYAVVPLPNAPLPGTGGESIADALTRISSHELAEAVTNPDQSGWTDFVGPEPRAEIADLCQTDTTVNMNGFAVTKLWLNSQNGCALASSAPPAAPTGLKVEPTGNSSSVA
jgi:hypothetical protein